MNSECNTNTINVRPNAQRATRRAARSVANAVPWRLAHRDYFLPKASGRVNGGTAPPTLSAHTSGPL
jgi:hypothetical protein